MPYWYQMWLQNTADIRDLRGKVWGFFGTPTLGPHNDPLFFALTQIVSFIDLTLDRPDYILPKSDWSNLSSTPKLTSFILQRTHTNTPWN